MTSADVWARIVGNCERVGDCLVWKGWKNRKGYAQVSLKGRLVYVHRAAYESQVGPIPAGFVIDHVAARGCRFRACCEPSHLEAVTNRENTLRGSSNFIATNSRKTHCPHGHPLVPGNLDNSELKRRGRSCLTCRRARVAVYQVKYRQRRKAA